MVGRILIVDDDFELAEEMSDLLSNEGYFVENTSDSSDGERLINKNNYDIYLFDYKMSVLDGVDLINRVKKINPKGVVLIISGRPFLEKILKEKNVYPFVSGLIKKPFNAEALLSKIKQFSLK